jgi:hypothetical protein
MRLLEEFDTYFSLNAAVYMVRTVYKLQPTILTEAFRDFSQSQ